MKQIGLIVPVLLVIVLMTAGCTNQQPAVQPTLVPATPVPVPSATGPAAATVPTDFTGQWTLTSLGIQQGTAVTYPTTEMTLTLNNDGSLTGYDGCNNYFGTFTLTGTTTPKGKGMTISGIGSTKKYCAGLANQEQQYLNILSKTTTYNIDGTSRLVLTGEMGDVLMYQRSGTIPAPTWARGY